MAQQFHKPTLFSNTIFTSFKGGEDPAEISRFAHATAAALLSRVQKNSDPAVIERLISYTDLHGIDAIAQLWAAAAAHSLPGVLWRMYLLRALVSNDPEQSSYIFQRGNESLNTIDPLVTGAVTPTGPTEIAELADQLLRGIFQGDFAIAVERAAAFCRLMASGCASLADDLDESFSERAAEFTTRAARFQTTSTELSSCAFLWRRNSLE